MSADREPGAAAAGVEAGEKFKHEIAADVSISGRISFPGNARIDGRLSGEVRADALLVIGATATLQANVRAGRLVVFGVIQGDVRQTDSVELHPGSRLVGTLEAQRVVVHAGAVFEGRCRIGRLAGAEPGHLRPHAARVHRA